MRAFPRMRCECALMRLLAHARISPHAMRCDAMRCECAHQGGTYACPVLYQGSLQWFGSKYRPTCEACPYSPYITTHTTLILPPLGSESVGTASPPGLSGADKEGWCKSISQAAFRRWNCVGSVMMYHSHDESIDYSVFQHVIII